MENLQTAARNNSGSRNTPAPKIKAPPRRLAGIENAPVLTYRARGQHVDGVLGAGREDMTTDFISRSLARIIRKGIRTAHVREFGGGSFALSPQLPAGTFALRTADRITLYQSESAAPIVEVPCDTTGVASA